jgi:hypothetical protein
MKIPTRKCRGFDRPSAEARPLAMATVRLAVADWTETKERLAEANRRRDVSETDKEERDLEESSEWERWVNARVIAMLYSKKWVMSLVLLACGAIDSVCPLKPMPPGWQPVALELSEEPGTFGGPIFVVFPRDPDSNDWVPQLTVVLDSDFDSHQFGNEMWDEPTDAPVKPVRPA